MIMRYWGIFQCLTVLAQDSEDLRLLHVGWRQMEQGSCWLCRLTWYIGVEGGNMLITKGSNLPHKIRWKEIEEKSHWQQNIPISHEHLKITGWKQRSEMKEAYFITDPYDRFILQIIIYFPLLLMSLLFHLQHLIMTLKGWPVLQRKTYLVCEFIHLKSSLLKI